MNRSVRSSKSRSGKGARDFFSSKHPDRLRSPRPFSWYCGSFPEVMRPLFEVNCSPPSSAEIKNKCSCISSLSIRLHDIYKEHFTFYACISPSITFSVLQHVDPIYLLPNPCVISNVFIVIATRAACVKYSYAPHNGVSVNDGSHYDSDTIRLRYYNITS